MIKVRYYAPLLAAVMLISVTVFQSWQLTSLLGNREWQHSAYVLHNVAERNQVYLTRRFKEQDYKSIQQVVSEINVPRRVTQAFLIDENNRVIAADRLGYEGSDVTQLPIKASIPNVKKARNALQSSIVESRQDGSIAAYFPVPMDREDEMPFTRTGVLVINVEVARGMAEVNALVLKSLSKSLLVIFFLVTFIAVCLYFLLTRRVARMLSVSDRYLAGEKMARNREHGSDEIGEIARAFNAVADSAERRQRELQDSQNEISKLNQTLEQRVVERTQALENEIEERKRAEDSLRASELELQQLLELAPDGIIVIDRWGTITKFNNAAEKMFGWPKAEAIGTNIKYMMPEPVQSNHDQILATYHRTRVRHLIGKTPEVEGLHRSGQHVPISITVSEIKLGTEPYYIGIVRDMSERKANEAALAAARQSLLEAEKMASLGGIVAGVAHEINTPVGVGVTAVSHLRDELDEFTDRYKSGAMTRTDLDQLLSTSSGAVRIIEDNLVRASELVRSFKEIAVDRTGDDVREIVLRDYIGQVLSSLKPSLKNRAIAISVSVTPPDLRITLQPGGISQIITNLVMNSLVHGFGPADKGELRFTVTTKGSRLNLQYQDNGSGMTDEVQTHIFDPFFTTMRGRGGSGLGMHIVYNLITQKYGGTITCDSAVGKGVTFNISLPLKATQKVQIAKA